MLQNIDQPKLTVGDVRKIMELNQPQPLPPPPVPAIEMPVNTDPEPKRESPGMGRPSVYLETIHSMINFLVK